MEELEESNVIWPDYPHHHYYRLHVDDDFAYKEHNFGKNKNPISLPINIPTQILSTNSCSNYRDSDQSEHPEEGKEMVPPHVMAETRRIGRKMAFSVCTGNGRTLKGRDLSKVRNSVLRMTGFLET